MKHLLLLVLLSTTTIIRVTEADEFLRLLVGEVNKRMAFKLQT